MRSLPFSISANRISESTSSNGMNLINAIARSMGREYAEAVAAPAALPRAAQQGVAAQGKPVLQLNPLPITLDANVYRNPRSDSNPTGDLRSLFAFRLVADPVPAFSHYYSPSGRSTEAIYGQIVEGASVTDGSTFTERVIADATKQFNQQSFANMDGTPGQWRPVYAVPGDWYDTSQDGRYKDLDFDLNEQGGEAGPFAVIGGQSDWQLSVGGILGSAAPLDPRTKIRSITMKYLLVQFRRPWLNPLLFESAGWYLEGQPEGFCSSGKTDANAGVLPLVPAGMLLAKDISVDADWSQADQAILASARASRQPVFLGPFAVQSQGSNSSLQVIGWISSLVPYSPQASNLRAGSVLVTNKGAFVSRFSVQWLQGGRPTANESGNFPVLAAKNIRIPSDARSVSIKIEIMTFPPPVETWKTVATYEFDTPVKKCYELAGVTWNPIVKETSCAK